MCKDEIFKDINIFMNNMHWVGIYEIFEINLSGYESFHDGLKASKKSG